MNQLLTKKITVSGVVQGVGYRSWLQKLCKNNNEVEAVFIKINEGLFKNILSNCFLGPEKAIIQNVLVGDFAPKGEAKNTFQIKK